MLQARICGPCQLQKRGATKSICSVTCRAQCEMELQVDVTAARAGGLWRPQDPCRLEALLAPPGTRLRPL